MSPNEIAYNTAASPLHVISESSSTDPNIISTIAANAAANRKFFRVTTGAQSVVISGYLVLQLTNPSNSGKIAYMALLYGSASATGTVDIFRNATFSTSGTSLTPRNSYFGATDNSGMTVKYLIQGSDPTTGGQLLSSVTQASGAFITNFDGTIIVPPNNTILLRLTNANLTNTISLNASWWEL